MAFGEEAAEDVGGGRRAVVVREVKGKDIAGAVNERVVADGNEEIGVAVHGGGVGLGG